MQRCLPTLSSAMRPLTAGTLLHTIRSDPGMTTKYYANRYFGPEKHMQLEHLLWKELKKHGKVTLDRIDGPDAPPRWVPLFYYPKRHGVRRHNPEDEDLSVLRHASDSSSVEHASSSAAGEATVEEDKKEMEDRDSAIIRLVHSSPGRDIQFYVLQLPEEMQQGAPQAFRRLRQAGVLQRNQTSQGTFAWVC